MPKRVGNLAALSVLVVVFAIALSLTASCGGKSKGGEGFTDPRDKQKYRTVKVGSQTWMAENLSFKTGGAWCYGGDDANCDAYGRLYDWETARLVCPSGWHLPSRDEWGRLTAAAGGGLAGRALKSKAGWGDLEGKGNNGTDEFGFAALPGGLRGVDGEFAAAGRNGFWWSLSEGDLGRIAYKLGGGGGAEADGAAEVDTDPRGGFSVRCVKDEAATAGEPAAGGEDEEAVVDTASVLSISDSVALSAKSTYSFRAKIPVFDAITDAQLLKSIYAPAEIVTDDYSREGLRKALAAQKDKYLADYRKSDDWIGYGGMGIEDYFDMEVASKSSSYITVTYAHGGFWGGAHGGHNVKTRVFDLKNGRPVALKDIVKNPADKAWGKIVKAHFLLQDKEREDCVDADTIPLSENFSFDNTGITFEYNQYEIAAYACGTFSIKVPFDRVTEKMLTPDFAKLAVQNPAICTPLPEGVIDFASIDRAKNFSLSFALCDENLSVGYVQYRGQTARILVQFDRDETKTFYDEDGDADTREEKHFNEIINGKVNGTYVLNVSGLSTMSRVARAEWHAYYIGKKDNQRIDMKIVEDKAASTRAREEDAARARAEAEAAAAAAAAAAAGGGDW